MNCQRQLPPRRQRAGAAIIEFPGPARDARLSPGRGGRDEAAPSPDGGAGPPVIFASGARPRFWLLPSATAFVLAIVVLWILAPAAWTVFTGGVAPGGAP